VYASVRPAMSLSRQISAGILVKSLPDPKPKCPPLFSQNIEENLLDMEEVVADALSLIAEAAEEAETRTNLHNSYISKLAAQGLGKYYNLLQVAGYDGPDFVKDETPSVLAEVLQCTLEVRKSGGGFKFRVHLTTPNPIRMLRKSIPLRLHWCDGD